MIRMKSGELEHFVTCGQMKLLERRADEDGLSYYQMMENAGTQAAQLILQYCGLAEACEKICADGWMPRPAADGCSNAA